MQKANQYANHRISPEIIVWLYHRFSLIFRDIENLMTQRVGIVSYESIRRWCRQFGPQYLKALRRCESKGADRWCADEVYLKINGEYFYLWRAVDQVGDVLDVLIQRRRNRVAADLFCYGRHMLRAKNHRLMRNRAF